MKIRITESMVIESAIKQIEQRLRRIEVALVVRRHSKRKHQVKKMQCKLIYIHAELVKKLQSLPGY